MDHRAIVRLATTLTWLMLHASTSAAAPSAIKDSILILDASGSMWGQIEGVNKIVIAKDVVEGLIRSLPEQQRLGFVAYGHRRKGDCEDIETLADVGVEREKVIDALRALSPRGKTPLSKSVEHAATQLNYTRQAATVILVSDGLETCDADPCALARTLEANGLDFTVHVVGFDVTEQERKGLSCIAQETGGSFFAADNADELTQALGDVAAVTGAGETPKTDASPVPSTVALKASILAGGPLIQSKLHWSIVPAGGGDAVFTASDSGAVTTQILPGEYTAQVQWSGWRGGDVPKSGHSRFTVKPQQPKVVTVPVDLELPVSLDAPGSTPEGTPFEVSWSGPDELGAYLHVSALDDGPRDVIYLLDATKARSAHTGSIDAVQADTNGDGAVDHHDLASTTLAGPSIAGEYEVRYVLDQPRLVLARQPLTVTDSDYAVNAPQRVAASATIAVDWQGPLTDGDFVTVIKAGSDKAFENGRTAKLTAGQPAELTAPPEPGEYEVRYVMANGYTTYPGMQHAVQASTPITVDAVEAAIIAPAEAIGGSSIQIEWQGVGDGWEDDLVSIVLAGAKRSNRFSQVSLRKSETPQARSIALRVPSVPGDYEAVYVLQPGSKIIARTPLTVTPAAASVDAPDTVKAGQPFVVQYSGKGFSGDRVVVVKADVPASKMWSTTPRYGFIAKGDATEGNVSAYPIAAGPGEYEARYVTGVEHHILARDPFTVVE